MPLAQAYLITTKNLDAFLNSIQAGQAPERFTNAFLQQLGFASSNDRLFIRLLKELDFVDDSGVPQKRYFEFLDQTQAKRVMAEAVKEAYQDLFVLTKQAWKWTAAEVYNKMKTLTEGKKAENVVNLMANTFKALCDWADWSAPITEKPQQEEKNPALKNEGQPEKQAVEINEMHSPAPKGMTGKTQLHYNLQIILPATRDSAVYDAIFQSLRKHLID